MMRYLVPLLLLVSVALTVVASAEENTTTYPTITIPEIETISIAPQVTLSFRWNQDKVTIVYVCLYINETCKPLHVVVYNNSTNTTIWEGDLGPGTCKNSVCRDTVEVSHANTTIRVVATYENTTTVFYVVPPPSITMESEWGRLVLTLLPLMVLVAFSFRGKLEDCAAGMMAAGIITLFLTYLGAPTISTVAASLELLCGLILLILATRR